MSTNRKLLPLDLRQKYEFSDSMHQGGNAYVYKCVRKSDGASCAVKILKTPYGRSLERFRREVAVAKEWSARTDRIMPILDVGLCDKWYSMPWAERCNSRQNDCSDDEWARFVIKEMGALARLLGGLHSAGICHRDIKPANILLYKGHFVLSDFGLVKNKAMKSDLTMGQKKLGPVFTMAPEMRRQPAEADGAAADVYSLGKTLWMLLANDEQGFDGQYLWRDESVQLHREGRYKNVPLAQIEMLLNQATENDPGKRPSGEDFAKVLEAWLRIVDVDFLAQRNEWDLLAKSLFNGEVPRRAEYCEVRAIVAVLKQLVARPSYNHVLYPDGGGLDFRSVDFAEEKGCVAIRTNGDTVILRPKCLHVEVYPEGENSYFLLEADELPLLKDVDDNGPVCQRVVEDTPGHYVSARAAQYGVYDYDLGKKFPENWRVIRRYAKGKFLVVPKFGPYNHISSVYDGRHNDATVELFRQYMDCVAVTSKIQRKTGYVEGQSLFDNDIFKRNIFVAEKDEGSQIHIVDDRLRTEIEAFDFSKCMTGDAQLAVPPKLQFWVEIAGMDPEGPFGRVLSGGATILQRTGHFRKNTTPDDQAYYLFSREKAASLCAEVSRFFCGRYETDTDRLSGELFVHGEWKCIARPTYVFSRAELEARIRDADDRVDNRVVVDEDGRVNVIPGGPNYVHYPVENEIYCAGNAYVGKYADYSKERLDELYGSLLNAFLEYIRTGRHVFVDFLVDYDAAELLQKIESEFRTCTGAAG